MPRLLARLSLPVLFILSAAVAFAQLRPAVGIRQNTPAIHAITNVRIVTAPGKVIDKGTLVMRDGIITAVGAAVTPPADARVWDMTGMTVYPGFIDGYSDLGVPKKPKPGEQQQQQGGPPAKQEPRGEHLWNDNVLAAQRADALFMPDAAAAEKLRSVGFTAAHVMPQKGIFRGSSALVSLGDATPNQLVLRSDIAQGVTFETAQGDDYPGSLMGTIALIRQTMLDAQWHRSASGAATLYPSEPRPDVVEDLAALERAVTGRQPVLMETGDELAILRADRIAKEFKLHLWIRGSGYEYRQLNAVKQVGAPIILPVNFPETPAVQTPEDALNVSLQELRYWDEAPENPGKLQSAGVVFALTSATLKDPASFLGNVRKAVDRGLSATAALAALTTTPAGLLGVEKKLGTLEAGKLADFIVTDGEIFSEKTKIRETWVDGRRYEVKAKPEVDLRGTWLTQFNGAPVDSMTLTLKGEPDGLQATGKAKGKEVKFTSASFSDLRFTAVFPGDSIGLHGVVRMTAVFGGDKLVGTGELASGDGFRWSASRTAPFQPEPDTAKQKPVVMASFPPVYPPGEFGRPGIPEQADKLFIKGGTVWTCGPQGILRDADVLVEKGKITRIGPGLTAPKDALVVQAAGKDVTPGIIDCHSHTAVAGDVNEATQAITAEVRIGDVVDPYDISIYRQLAGGVTAANVLHGSANPIGGQNQVIKMRWGTLPEQMKFEGAMPGIKFALGENPKQSNWGDRYTTRYPQTRQGVEQIIRDEFRAALDYERAWKLFESGKKKVPPRKDIQAETILEILKGKRLVHSHSYRQDEIEMLMRVAEDFGFRVATFQHVLEGYKVADQMAKHGAGASTFSDWWAYKFEVYDAIPYNGTLMHDQDVVVSFNSDSDEQARRLNTEAAKAVKYGGTTEEEALKFVTINPAKQLRIDKRVGSLEVGKDADIAIWSGNPLSTYSICEQTWVDGRRYFDRAENTALVGEIQKERSVLIQKALTSGKSGASGDAKGPKSGEKRNYSCQDDDRSEGH
jgi:imidazolonepropionase-like amidohydrolase